MKEFPISKGTKQTPYIILFDAYTGMGKSSVSLSIAKYDNSIILNNDQVRKWLSDYADEGNLKDKIHKHRLENLLKNINSCICDSCFCHNWKQKIKYYDDLGYKYYIIRLICSDETIADRLSKREIDGINYSIASYDDYLWMKNNVSKVDDNKIDYIINTEKNVDEQVLSFLNKYNLVK